MKFLNEIISNKNEIVKYTFKNVCQKFVKKYAYIYFFTITFLQQILFAISPLQDRKYSRNNDANPNA